jgi:hypothetical protein
MHKKLGEWNLILNNENISVKKYGFNVNHPEVFIQFIQSIKE